jgi:hypothetical protein
LIKYLAFIFLTGCASVSYEKVNPDGSSERLVINSLFRSLEGLKAERDKFKIEINKAEPTATPEDIAEALRLFKPL